MPTCAGIKRDGGRCTVSVAPGAQWCFNHDPARADERRRNAARGGKGKASGEVGRVKARLQALADRVLEGTLDRADAAVVSQIWNVYLSAVRTDLKVREVTELEERLAELESGLEQRRDGSRWGA